MSNYVPPEINRQSGGILLVGRDPGRQEDAQRLPFVGPAGQILWDAARDAGIRREDVNVCNVVPFQPPGNDFKRHSIAAIREGKDEVFDIIGRTSPSVVVALGNEAAFTLIPGWPTRNNSVSGSYGVQNRRGYIFEGYSGIKVIPTIHPALILRSWVPWRVLLAKDLIRAKEESHEPAITRPARTVEIIQNPLRAAKIVKLLASNDRLACDIEITSGTRPRTACIGFAPSGRYAFVMHGAALDNAMQLLREYTGTWVFCNGQFDLHFLYTRDDVRVSGSTIDDVMIAWHSCYPELAGKSDSKSYKATRKSLAFLSSIMTKDPWWKDYNFKKAEDQYELNGLDCCVTFDIMESLDAEIDRLNVREIYEHGCSMVWPVVMMQSRGMHVDEKLRRLRRKHLRREADRLHDEIIQLAMPIIKANMNHKQSHLFVEKWTCPCCRGGKVKSQKCWSCSGFSKKPTAKEAKSTTLKPCEVCEGVGKRQSVTFNPKSAAQQRILLYDMLKIRPRFSNKRITADEGALKSILAEVQDVVQKEEAK